MKLALIATPAAPAARRLSVRASAAATSTAQPRTLKALNITRATLVDSNSGRAVRNVDGEIYEIVYSAETDSVKARPSRLPLYQCGQPC